MDIGPWIISGVALMQVWIIALLKWLIRPRVKIYETGNLEIGYGGFGPSLGVVGTLHVNKGEVFVKEIRCRVRHCMDGTTRDFNWRAFRGNALLPDAKNFEIAGGFLLTSNNPFRFNIFFADARFLAEISPKLKSAPSRWFEYKIAKSKIIAEEHNLNEEQVIKNELVIETVYQEFSQNKGTLDEFTALNNAFYWKPGDYQVDIHVIGENNKPACVITKNFVISEDQSNQLRLNCVQQCRELLGLPTNYFFIYPEYFEANKGMQGTSHPPARR